MGDMIILDIFLLQIYNSALVLLWICSFLLLQNVNREPAESRWRPALQGRGSSGGRANFSSHYPSRGKQISDKVFKIMMSDSHSDFAASTCVCFLTSYALLWLAVLKACNLFSNCINCTILLSLFKQIFCAIRWHCWCLF